MTENRSVCGSVPPLGTMNLLFIIEKQSFSIMAWGQSHTQSHTLASRNWKFGESVSQRQAVHQHPDNVVITGESVSQRQAVHQHPDNVVITGESVSQRQAVHQ